jgi:alkylation response protein AidB-like acyl-CoA dehydrogenase
MTPGRSDEQAQFAASLHGMLADAAVPVAVRSWAAGDRAPGLAIWRALAGLGVTALAVPERHGGAGARFADIVVACEELGHHAVPGPVAESVAAVPVLLAALSGEPLSGEPLSGKPLPGRQLPGEQLPGEQLPGEQLSENELSEIVVSENAVSGDAVSGAALPARAWRGGAPSGAARSGTDLADAARPGWGTPGPWLAGLAAGELIATAAIPPWLPWAVDAETAGLVLLAEGDAVRLGTPGPGQRSVDPGRSLSPVTGGQVLARGPAVAGAVARALNAGALACAAQLLGAGRALLEASVRHAGQRAQFGRPIGAFQAVKHHLADVAIGLEFAGPLLDAAAAALDGNGCHAARDVSAAKVACTDAARRAALAALQVHGAIGYTEEHDLHLWLLKVRALAGAWGGQAEHRARVIAAIAVPEGAREAAGPEAASPEAARPATSGQHGAGQQAAGEPAWS